MRRVKVLPYNPDCKLRYMREAEILVHLFDTELVEIHHIGSTSVEGLAAKLIIDIMPVVREIALIDDFDISMKSLGYEVRGENGIPRRRYFHKGGETRTVHVHVFEDGDENITRHLAFRDYLRTFAKVRDDYSALKIDLATSYPVDIKQYINGKHEFVIDTERLAKEWYLKQHQDEQQRNH